MALPFWDDFLNWIERTFLFKPVKRKYIKQNIPYWNDSEMRKRVKANADSK